MKLQQPRVCQATGFAAPSNQHSNSGLPESRTYSLVSAEWLFVCLLSFYSDKSFLSCFLPPITAVFAW